MHQGCVNSGQVCNCAERVYVQDSIAAEFTEKITKTMAAGTVAIRSNPGDWQKMPIMQKEIFGPVLPIATFSDLDAVIEMASDCEYGLTSSIYTRSLDVAMRVQ